MNKKGFILIETLVVTLFVLFIFTILYNSAIPLLGKYNELAYYDDLDTTYDLYYLRNLITRDPNYDSIKSNHYKKLQCSDLNNSLLCSELFDVLEIDSSDEIIFLNMNYVNELRNDSKVSYDIKNYLRYVNTTGNILILQKNGYLSYLNMNELMCYETSYDYSYKINPIIKNQDENDLTTELAYCVSMYKNHALKVDVVSYCKNVDGLFEEAVNSIPIFNSELAELLENNIIVIDNVKGIVIDHYSSYCPKDVVIPSTMKGYRVSKINSRAFNNNDINSVVIPNTVTEIFEEAFRFNNIKEIIIPNSVNFIGASAFKENKIETLSFEGNSELEFIDASAFEFNKLKTVRIPKSVIQIEYRAFANNEISSVIFEENSNLDYIASRSFRGALHTLSKATIPNSVTTFYCDAFNDDVEITKNESLICIENTVS